MIHFNRALLPSMLLISHIYKPSVLKQEVPTPWVSMPQIMFASLPVTPVGQPWWITSINWCKGKRLQSETEKHPTAMVPVYDMWRCVWRKTGKQLLKRLKNNQRDKAMGTTYVGENEFLRELWSLSLFVMKFKKQMGDFPQIRGWWENSCQAEHIVVVYMRVMWIPNRINNH